MLVNLLTTKLQHDQHDFNVRDTEDGLHRQVSFLSHRLVGSISCCASKGDEETGRQYGGNVEISWWLMVVNGDLMVVNMGIPMVNGQSW